MGADNKDVVGAVGADINNRRVGEVAAEFAPAGVKPGGGVAGAEDAIDATDQHNFVVRGGRSAKNFDRADAPGGRRCIADGGPAGALVGAAEHVGPIRDIDSLPVVRVHGD